MRCTSFSSSGNAVIKSIPRRASIGASVYNLDKIGSYCARLKVLARRERPDFHGQRHMGKKGHMPCVFQHTSFFQHSTKRLRKGHFIHKAVP